MKRIPFSQVLKTAAIDIRREYDRLYGMFCVQKFQDMVGAGSSLKDYCATYFVRLPFRGTCVSLDDFDDFYGYSFEKNPSTFDIEYLDLSIFQKANRATSLIKPLFQVLMITSEILLEYHNFSISI